MGERRQQRSAVPGVVGEDGVRRRVRARPDQRGDVFTGHRRDVAAERGDPEGAARRLVDEERAHRHAPVAGLAIERGAEPDRGEPHPLGGKGRGEEKQGGTGDAPGRVRSARDELGGDDAQRHDQPEPDARGIESRPAGQRLRQRSGEEQRLDAQDQKRGGAGLAARPQNGERETESQGKRRQRAQVGDQKEWPKRGAWARPEPRRKASGQMRSAPRLGREPLPCPGSHAGHGRLEPDQEKREKQNERRGARDESIPQSAAPGCAVTRHWQQHQARPDRQETHRRQNVNGDDARGQDSRSERQPEVRVFPEGQQVAQEQEPDHGRQDRGGASPLLEELRISGKKERAGGGRGGGQGGEGEGPQQRVQCEGHSGQRETQYIYC